MEILSLTREGDLVIAKLDNYYLLLVHPSKRECRLDWYEAKDYCASIEASLPTKDELNLIYINKGDINLAEAHIYKNEINTLDYISKRHSDIHKYYPWVWSSSEGNSGGAWFQYFNSGNQLNNVKNNTYGWVLPVRRIPV